MDAPNDAIDFLELATVASLYGGSFPIVGWGSRLIVLLAPSLSAAPSSSASAATAPIPATAAPALATRGAISSNVPGKAAVVAAVVFGSSSSTLLTLGEVP